MEFSLQKENSLESFLKMARKLAVKNGEGKSQDLHSVSRKCQIAVLLTHSLNPYRVLVRKHIIPVY